ncbi:hypothetical protein LTR09_002977 [Extremus antarcticus]|uniref:Uncharacterized protein n=1 Tax=Extremus antarcticus TaxID=702011 RepID=A0AAJ0GFF3_9PEZI|nr:hypothetical protein LTR09_002977 [Extremus antarcticus]
MAKLLKKYNASNAKIRAEKRGSASNVQADEDESVSTNRPISEEDWQSLMADSVLLKDCGFTNADLEGFMLEES